jgi:hypothetical protein
MNETLHPSPVKVGDPTTDAEHDLQMAQRPSAQSPRARRCYQFLKTLR